MKRSELRQMIREEVAKATSKRVVHEGFLGGMKALMGAKKVADEMKVASAALKNVKPVENPEQARKVFGDLINKAMKSIKTNIGVHDEEMADTFAATFCYSLGQGLYSSLNVSGGELKELMGWTSEEYRMYMVKNGAQFAWDLWRKA